MRSSIQAAAIILAASTASAQAPTAEEITAPGPEGNLAGTMLAPSAGKPVILIVPGSGPTDRDGNNPLGVSAASYKLLGQALAERGIGSVRIDKRGMFGSAAAVPDANAVTVSAYVDDVQSWVDVIRKRTGLPCVWLAGHSEGGLVALAASKKAEGLCGLVLLAAPGRKSGDILRDQLSANPANAPVMQDAFSIIAELEAGRRVDVSDMHPALGSLFAPQVQDFLMDIMALDPAQLASDTDLPMLIVQGEQDIQVLVKDAVLLHEAKPDSTLHLLPGVNHVLKRVKSDDRAANIATYSNPDLPLAPAVVEAVTTFVLRGQESE